MSINNMMRVCLSDSHDGETRYLYCKYCHKIITVTPPKMTFTKLEGDLTNFILLDTKMVVNARCNKCLSDFVEIHGDTVIAHKACAALGISIFYDYGEIIAYDPDLITRNWKGDRPIFKFPSLEILDIEWEDKRKKLFELIEAYKDKLIVKQHPGYCGDKIYVKFEAIIHTSLAKNTDELCSKEYFDKMDREINDARTYMEQIIDQLIRST